MAWNRINHGEFESFDLNNMYGRRAHEDGYTIIRESDSRKKAWNLVRFEGYTNPGELEVILKCLERPL
jgi:hypothetical protein